MKLEAMISSTLSFARDDAENEPMERVNLTALVDSICVDLSDAGYSITFNEDEELIHECRPGAIKRALSNLVENAVKYGNAAHVELQTVGSMIEITIDDNGPGIPEEELEQVFTPFYRVDQSRNPETGGVGLGLSVAQSIIDKHGGKISLSNREESGLRVQILLPI